MGPIQGCNSVMSAVETDGRPC